MVDGSEDLFCEINKICFGKYIPEIIQKEKSISHFKKG